MPWRCGRIKAKPPRSKPYAARTPNTNEPIDAAINIAKFTRSVIFPALPRPSWHLELLRLWLPSDLKLPVSTKTAQKTVLSDSLRSLAIRSAVPYWQLGYPSADGRTVLSPSQFRTNSVSLRLGTGSSDPSRPLTALNLSNSKPSHVCISAHPRNPLRWDSLQTLVTVATRGLKSFIPILPPIRISHPRFPALCLLR